MNISGVNTNQYSFKAIQNKEAKKSSANKDQGEKNQNPISKGGEKALLVKGTFLAGLGLGARLLFELFDGDFIVDTLGKEAKKINKRNANLSPAKKILSGIGIWGGLILMFIGGFAALYTLFKAPKINYQGNINSFQKGKDMDIYIKGNEVEKELYTQMNEKAKTGNAADKEKLKTQYMQMQMAKNQVPDFVKLKK